MRMNGKLNGSNSSGLVRVRQDRRPSPVGLLAALTLLLAGGPVAAKVIREIPPGGLVIDKSGHYNIQENLTYSGGGAAIRITASDVTLDLKGHTLSGPVDLLGTLGGLVGIELQGAQRVTLRDGTVTGLGYGIQLLGSSNNTIENLTVSGSGISGIRLGSASNSNTIRYSTLSSHRLSGILLSFSTSNTIENITTTGSEVGIHLHGANSNTLQNNIAIGNILGIGLYGADDNTIQNNTTTGNSLAGIRLTAQSNNNTIQNNTASGNANGIRLDPLTGTNNLIENNVALGNSEFDLYDANLPAACVNTWLSNTFVTDNETGAASGPGAGCIQ